MSRAKPSVRSVRPALVLTALATLVFTLTAGTTQAGPSAALASDPYSPSPRRSTYRRR